MSGWVPPSTTFLFLFPPQLKKALSCPVYRKAHDDDEKAMQ